MTNQELENRIAVLEAEVALLKTKITEESQKTEIPWWKKRIGVFADDPAYDEAMRLGREYRISQIEEYEEEEK